MARILTPAGQDLLFRRARTVRRFAAEPVSDQDIRLIYELIKYGPTAANLQPLRLVLVRSTPARARLVGLMDLRNRMTVWQAPLVVILAADLHFHEHADLLNPRAQGWFADAEARGRSARFNAALQMGYFIVGVRAAGFAAGPMTGFDADGVDREFFLDGRLVSIAVVNIGRPDEAGPNQERGPRLAFEDVVTTV